MAFSSAAKMGANGRAAIKGGAGDTDWSAGSTYAFPFIPPESMVIKESVLDVAGIRGSRARHSEIQRAGTTEVGGNLTVAASPTLLENFLPYILGTAKSAGGGVSGDNGASDRFSISDTLLPFGLLIDKVGAIYEFQDCHVGKATFSGTRDQPITLSMDIVGKGHEVESSWDSNIAAIAVTATNNPYLFHDVSVMSLDGDAGVKPDSFTLTIDNALDVRFRNSQTANDITPQDLIVTLSVLVPFNSSNYTALLNGTETAGKIVITDGTYPCTIPMAHLTQTKTTPVIAGKTEIGIQLEYEARALAYVAATVSTHPIYFDVDSTT